MLRLITGNPGSGKTYYAMQYLKKYCDYDKHLNLFCLNPDVLIITNIEGVKINHVSFDEIYEQGLINYDKFREYAQSKGYKKIILIVDECQRYFANLKDNEQFYFFEYHRHLGIDILMICQVASALPKRLVELCEFVINAKPRSIKMAGFQYDFLDAVSRNKLYSTTVKPNKSVFTLYQSYIVDEKVKPKSVARTKLVVGLVTMIVMLVIGTYYLKNGFAFTPRDKETKQQKKVMLTKKEDVKKEQHQANIVEPKKEIQKEKTVITQENNKVDDERGKWISFNDKDLKYNDIKVGEGNIKGKMSYNGKIYLLY